MRIYCGLKLILYIIEEKRRYHKNSKYSYRNVSIQIDRAVIKFSVLIKVMDPPLPILRANYVGKSIRKLQMDIELKQEY
jgi:hypothetical protein